MFRGCTSGASARAPGDASREPGERSEIVEQAEPANDGLRMKIEYCDVTKRTAEEPPMNAESELSLDGMVMGNEGRLRKVKNVAGKMYQQFRGKSPTEGAIEIPNQSIMHHVLHGKYEGETAEPVSGKQTPCFTCIESAKLPFKYDGDEDDSDDDDDPLIAELNRSGSHQYLPGYMRGMAISSFYDRDFERASRYLWNEFNHAGSESNMDVQIDAQLLDLECDLQQNKCRRIEEKTIKLIDSIGRAAEEISLRDILIWIEELQSSDRHFGSVLLCLAVILRVPVKEPENTAWHFQLDYYTFVEMALRVVYIMGRNAAYANHVVFLLDAMDKSICRLKIYLDECPGVTKKEIQKKISTCYLALSYCCNSVGLYESAQSCTDDGMSNLTGDHVIKADLLVNRAASLLGRRVLPEAREDLDDALTMLEKEAIGGGRSAINWRLELTRKMRSRLKKMEKNKMREDKWSR